MVDRAPDIKALSEKLITICACYPTARPQMVADVVRAVIDSLGSALSSHETDLLSQVEDLGKTIAAAKEEIAALKADDSTSHHVSTASIELDAVVSHTAEATNSILEACEMLDAAAGGPDGPQASAVQDATMRIYEACSFQDITGQRITKVVNTLKVVEAKVAKIMETFGAHRWEEIMPKGEAEGQRVNGHLLNGPQLPATALAQADIDAMLADF